MTRKSKKNASAIADREFGPDGEVRMDIQITECKRKIPCVNCDDEKCWFSGQLIADCPLYKCDRTDDLYEDCETCDFLKEHMKAIYEDRR